MTGFGMIVCHMGIINESIAVCNRDVVPTMRLTDPRIHSDADRVDHE